jgi:hypothetical protein
MNKYSHKKSHAGWWIAGGIAAIAIGLTLWGSYSGSTLTTRELALSCTTDALTQFHIHPHLRIIINGTEQIIPAGTGITLACLHPIHTHDSTGTIHIESPVARDFTLGDFFAVWNKPFSKDQILDYKADATHAVTITVNGIRVDTYENTVMHDHDDIVISYAATT